MYTSKDLQGIETPSRKRNSMDFGRRAKVQVFLALVLLMVWAVLFFDAKLSQRLRRTQTVLKWEANLVSDSDLLNYSKRYPAFFKCQNTFNEWNQSSKPDTLDFSQPAQAELHQMRITRAVVVNFPIVKLTHYIHELKWLYRSWVEMLKFEPVMWRTDLVIFIENDRLVFEKEDFFLNELHCRFDNVRKSAADPPMCTLVHYRAFKSREFPTQDLYEPLEAKYRHLLERVNVFEFNLDHFDKLYKLMKTEVNDYGYLDSILIGFEGYEFFKKARYDFIIRSDIDVFLTPLFAIWLPRHCNDFCVGRGAYSTAFNDKRLHRAAERVGLGYAGQKNLGSTWYSTPDQIRLVSFLSLFGMVYLALEEFSQVEREGKLGIQLWPDWHYLVLSMYGHTLALNHLMASNQTNVIQLENQMDFPSHITNSINRVLHIHVFHGYSMFSKFDFKSGKYDGLLLTEKQLESDDVRDYSLRMALDAKRTPNRVMFEHLQKTILNKI